MTTPRAQRKRMIAMPATSEKLQQLFKLLDRQPGDAFLLYGIGMEYKKLEELALSVDYFNKVICADVNYCYAYYQRGQVEEMRGDNNAAKQSYQEGIASAQRVNDAHAKSELQAALDFLE